MANAQWQCINDKRHLKLSCFGSLVHILGKINIETSEYDLLGKQTFQIP